MTEQPEIGERPKQNPPILFRCIDHRANEKIADWVTDQGILKGTYHLYASAGASGNPNGFLETVKTMSPDSILVADHEDCGFYKANNLYLGEDPNQAHHHNLEHLGTQLHSQNPNTDYHYQLIPLDTEERQLHGCDATAIMLGEPKIVLEAREKLARLGLSDHDEIARPYFLSPQDPTIWSDLQISLRLHKPSQIYLFDKDRQNALNIAEVVQKIAPSVTVIPIVFQLSQSRSFATILR